MTNTLLNKFSDAEILARTAYGECRGGGEEGMQSIMNVILNRAHNPKWWGKTVREVCLKPYQFSCWLQSDPNYEVITEVEDSDEDFAIALEMAKTALNGGLADITHGATYYFAESIHKWPHWAEGHTPCVEIAGQLFFNDIDA